MLRKITAQRFLKAAPLPIKKPQIDATLRTLIDKNNQILPEYVPVLKHLDTLTWTKNVKLLQDAQNDLKQSDLEASLVKFRRATQLMSPKGFNSFHELYSKHSPHEWDAAHKLIEQIAALPSAQSVKFTAGHLDLYFVPRIVRLKYRSDPGEAISYIHAFALQATSAVQFQAVNFAINEYLSKAGANLDVWRQIFMGLPAAIKPRIHYYNCARIHVENNRQEMLELWDLFMAHGVRVNTPRMSTYLRALFTSSDAGAQRIIDAIPECEFATGFYHFLVRVLCARKDAATIDWLFANRIMPLMETNPDLIPFLLHTLLIRTLEFEGFEQAKDVLNAMGTDVSEQSWKAIFREFRRLGQTEKAFDTLRRAIESFNLKLSFVLVNEYLLLVSQHFRPAVFLKALLTVYPEYEGTLHKLELLGINHIDSNEPDYMLRPHHRSFVVGSIHESTLALAYEVILNNEPRLESIMHLYTVYERYVLSHPAKTTTVIVDKFVSKLCDLRADGGVEAAVAVYRSALAHLPIKKALDGRFGSTSLYELATQLGRAGRINEAIDLARLTSDHKEMAIRGKALRKVYHELRETSEENGRVFEEWAITQGVQLRKKDDLQEDVL